MTIRDAQTGDLAAILAIYNEAVLTLTASYEYEPNTIEQREAWYAEKQAAGHPVLVAEGPDGLVAGWGALGPFRERYGYRFTVEDSIYVAAEHRGKGIGRMLLAELIARARVMGMHAVIAGIDSEGKESVRLHEAFGFQHVARFREVGFKFDRWLDVIFMELMLEPSEAT